jgi:hypothetical protein
MTDSVANSGFFAVDVRCFAEACTNLNDGVAYLVMACGTGGDHTTSAWAAKAVEKYTGISRNRSKEAVSRLIARELVLKPMNSKVHKLVSYAQRMGTAPDFTPLSDDQAQVLEVIRNGGSLTGKQKMHVSTLLRLNRIHVARDDFGQNYYAVTVPHEPKLAFIPNSFVTGIADETPPLERLRRYQDPLLLRLTIDLYHLHFENDGGVPKTIIRRKYDKTPKAQFGPYNVYEFKSGSRVAYDCDAIRPHTREQADGERDWSAVWKRFDLLEQAGVLEWLPVLFEVDSDLAEPLFPLGHGGTESLEDQLGDTAHQAAVRMLSRRYNLQEDAPGLGKASKDCQLIPLLRDFEQATLFGIARLRYRPRTARTALWFSNIAQKSTEYLAAWQEVISRVELQAREEFPVHQPIYD